MFSCKPNKMLLSCLSTVCSSSSVTTDSATEPSRGFKPHELHRLQLLVNSPLANFKSAGGKTVLPAVLIVVRVENALFVFFGGDVLLPLFLAVAILAAQPAVVARLQTDREAYLHRRLNTIITLQYAADGRLTTSSASSVGMWICLPLTLAALLAVSSPQPALCDCSHRSYSCSKSATGGTERERREGEME